MIGVDGSAKMLAVARAKVPGAGFCQGDLRALPVADQQVDLVTVSLALTHVPELAPVLAEFARVLRPGGHLVIADSRMDYPLVLAMPDGSYGYLPHRSRMTSEYLTAALPLGFEVRHCEELRAAPARCSPAGPVRAASRTRARPTRRRPSGCCPRIRQTSGHCAPGTQLRLPPPTTATRC